MPHSLVYGESSSWPIAVTRRCVGWAASREADRPVPCLFRSLIGSCDELERAGLAVSGEIGASTAWSRSEEGRDDCDRACRITLRSLPVMAVREGAASVRKSR